MIARALAAVLAAAVAFLGVHLVIAVAAAVIVVILAALGLAIATIVAECGWGIQPCRRRFAW
jgi:hypothetical protein